MIPAFLYSLYLTLYETNISLRWTVPVPKGFVLERVDGTKSSVINLLNLFIHLFIIYYLRNGSIKLLIIINLVIIK